MANAKTDDLPALTSLRFVAATMVVLAHATLYFGWAAPLRPIELGQGVSFFFVLSGFILTHVYSGRSTPYWKFLRARVARIWPVHLATLALVFVALPLNMRQLTGPGMFSEWVALVANVSLVHSIIPFQSFVYSYNSPSWSISTEMFFYLTFPFLLMGIERNWHWKLLGCAAFIVAYATIIHTTNLPAWPERSTQLSQFFLIYSSPLFRAFEFVLGMSAYLAWLRLGRLHGLNTVASSALEVAALGLVIAWFAGVGPMLKPLFNSSYVTAAWHSFAGASVAFSVLIVTFASGRGIFSRVLSLFPFVWLGQISFALYLFHQIAMKWLSWTAANGHIGAGGPATVFTICLCGAAVLHHLVERPAKRMLANPEVPSSETRMTPRLPWRRVRSKEGRDGQMMGEAAGRIGRTQKSLSGRP